LIIGELQVFFVEYLFLKRIWCREIFPQLLFKIFYLCLA
jgi:hypothetical protein